MNFKQRIHTFIVAMSSASKDVTLKAFEGLIGDFK